VYLSLLQGNILAGVGAMRTAIDVIRRYQAVKKSKLLWTVTLGVNSNRSIKQS